VVRIKDSEECRVVSGESGPVAKCSIELLIKNYVRRAKGNGDRDYCQSGLSSLWHEVPRVSGIGVRVNGLKGQLVCFVDFVCLVCLV
jgi:hypothetical protein